jgi:hypothetical protein
LGYRSLRDHEDGLKIMLSEEKMGLDKITSKALHEDLDKPHEKESKNADGSATGLSSGTKNKTSGSPRSETVPSVTGIEGFMKAMTIAPSKEKATIAEDDEAPSSTFSQEGQDEIVPKCLESSKSTPNPNEPLKKNARKRNKAKSKLSEDAQDQVPAASQKKSAPENQNAASKTTLSVDDQPQDLAALQKKSATESQNAAPKATLSPDAQAQVLAALERLSVQENEKSGSKNKAKSKSPESSGKSRGSPASTQPPRDSPLSSEQLKLIKDNTALLAENSDEAKKGKEKERESLKAREALGAKEATQARELKAESVCPSHSISTEKVSSMPEVYQP